MMELLPEHLLNLIELNKNFHQKIKALSNLEVELKYYLSYPILRIPVFEHSDLNELGILIEHHFLWIF